ncbi:MAG: GNAT family N-acetyltransferase [Leptolyngbyaceae cyanobacterium SM2_5_2]|nr:GNAT family N-acetyltransferase [Leptolyngbyaceae cyanobacterium SM2_5_2]
MLGPEALRAKKIDHSDLRIRQAEIPCPEFNRFLYTSVGGQWYWCDRLTWIYNCWMTYLNRPKLQTWVAYLTGTPAGYFELEEQGEGNVEIAYFGLLPQFVGQGLGAHLLTIAVEQTWEMGASRVWVHTCSLDRPYAYKNYESRGFSLYDTQAILRELAPQPPGPWPESYQQP